MRRLRVCERQGPYRRCRTTAITDVDDVFATNSDGLCPGKTAFSLDYFLVPDLRVDGDEAPSFGVCAVQKWFVVGVDFYVGWRGYEIDRPDRRLEPLNVVPFGVVSLF